MAGRVLALVVLVVAAGVVQHRMQPVEPSEVAPLEELPMALGAWLGHPAPPFDARTLEVLGVDDHLNRDYVAGGTRTANVYVGYYRSQERGASIHSPLNCLPGAGWEFVSADRVAFAQGTARRALVRKGREHLLIMYWYQTATRVEGDEYRSKLFTVVDTIRFRRNDAALVRVIARVGGGAAAEAAAARDVAEVADLLEPYVRRLLFPPAPPPASL